MTFFNASGVVKMCRTFTMDVTMAIGLPALHAGTSLKLAQWLIS